MLVGSTPVLVHNTGCPKAIALGLTVTDENEYSLQEFAEANGAQYYDHWDDFESAVRGALKEDSKTKIYFNLQGIGKPAMIKAAPSSAQARVVWVNGDNPFPSPEK
ncbi:hypothetical protein ACFY1J_42960 [Streptomyces sp. NPDC001406]|uniref:hypothetical protein n=1 Tax=Streptomyces sp. NPDC001406 TaxID=3364572 RepID=UPI0036CFDF7F